MAQTPKLADNGRAEADRKAKILSFICPGPASIGDDALLLDARASV